MISTLLCPLCKIVCPHWFTKCYGVVAHTDSPLVNQCLSIKVGNRPGFRMVEHILLIFLTPIRARAYEVHPETSYLFFPAFKPSSFTSTNYYSVKNTTRPKYGSVPDRSVWGLYSNIFLINLCVSGLSPSVISMGANRNGLFRLCLSMPRQGGQDRARDVIKLD
jgi:hypothetical protein